MMDLEIPGELECLSLLEKYKTPCHIVAHSKAVWAVGEILAEALIRHDCQLDRSLVRASCLLHDIGKYPCIVEGKGYHDVMGEQILEKEGFPNVGRIVVQHVVLRTPKDSPICEEHVVFYADKRVVHDRIVSLEDRFIYLEETYGRNASALGWLLEMKKQTMKLEDEIFNRVDFSPDDLVFLVKL
jgi:uncharacterized protein